MERLRGLNGPPFFVPSSGLTGAHRGVIVAQVLTHSSPVDTQLLQESARYKDVHVQIECIGPYLAERYLRQNFSNNRAKSKEWVKELAKEMRHDLFHLSTDAIGFDDQNRLINGQHRLTALIESGTSQFFVVIRNLPSKTAQLIDVGKKRSMAQRITIGGTPMTEKQCSAIRNAMVPYESKDVGNVIYARKIHDEQVEHYYLMHKDFLESEKIKAFEGKSGSAFFLAAAIRMYAQMIHDFDNGAEYVHGMDPMQRVCLWLELTRDGMSREFSVNPKTDNAAILVRNMRERTPVDNHRGLRWCTKQQLRTTISAAHNFMLGISPKHLRAHTYDPMTPLHKLPATSDL